MTWDDLDWKQWEYRVRYGIDYPESEEMKNLRTTIFNLHSPPANVYEFRMDELGNVTPKHKEGNKNMENVTQNPSTVDKQMAILATMEDRPYTDEEFEAILAQSDVKQDAEDVDPEAFETDKPLDS